MTPQESLNVLITAAHKGQSKGAYTLEEAVLIHEAIKLITTPTPEVVVPEPEKKQEETPTSQG